MAKASSKKKGPKGKKARRAAKLERHWGEHVDEDEIQKARMRKGKSRLGVKPKALSTSRKMMNFSKGIEQDAEADDSSLASSDDEHVDDLGEGRTLNSLLNYIKGVSKPSGNTMTSEDDDSDDSNSISSDGEASDTSVDSSSSCDGREERDFDFEGIKAKGANPYHIHFSKDPIPEKDAQQPPTSKGGLKKLKLDNVDESLVVQMSIEVKKKYEMSIMEQSLAIDSFCHVRKNIAKSWTRVNMKALHADADASGKEKSQPIFSELQAAIYPSISNYCDALVTCMNRENKAAVENIIGLHVLNHVLTANHDITSHNNQIRDIEKLNGADDNDQFRDQGYTRPKVLVLLPTRSAAYNFTKIMLNLLDKCSIEKEEKFEQEFGPLHLDEGDDKEAERRRKAVQKGKGKDWLELFGDEANSDDDFKIGISMSNTKNNQKKQKSGDKRVTVKFFSDFYHSDIILASPIGLKMVIDDGDDKEENDDNDFLSSIEVVVTLQADVLLMQNWDHMSLLGQLNEQPKKSTGIDFSRVRNYLLSCQASRWRQNIMVSRFNDPHLNSTFNRYAGSIAGKIKVRRKVPDENASFSNVLTQVRQVFQRVPCDSIVTNGEKKVKYFKDAILPHLIRTKQKHTLIYIPSYFDFISMRNILLKNELTSNHFVSVTEYARVSEVSRGRARFLQGKKRIMLYTGRAHFFMRHHIKGAKHLIMLGLPENAEFYPELLNMLSDQSTVEDGSMDIESPVSCINIFNKYDALNLERIVGTKHSERMVKSQKRTFLFNS